MVTTLRIKGMTCNGCVKHVTKALKDVAGVSAVEVSLADERAKVVHDPEQSPVPGLLAAIEAAGYTGSEG